MGNVSLPLSMVSGVRQLVRRGLQLSKTSEENDGLNRIVKALLKTDSPTFSDLESISTDQLIHAVQVVQPDFSERTRAEMLTKVFKSLSIRTPICPVCEEFPLQDTVSGFEVATTPGERCSFCTFGYTEQVPQTEGFVSGESFTELRIGKFSYLVEGLLAHGDEADVYLGRRNAALTERVVIKITRSINDDDLVRREWSNLQFLKQSQAQGFDYFSRLVPQPVACGRVTFSDNMQRSASVFRWHSGFNYTLEDIAREYPEGIAGPAMVWMWKRTLELLGWIHRSGLIHCAVLPTHILIHPRDHGARLVGFSCAVKTQGSTSSETIVGTSRGYEEYYPRNIRNRGALSTETDIVMSARCLLQLSGGSIQENRAHQSLPEELAEFVTRYASEHTSRARSTDAWEVLKELDQVARRVYGPPRYHRFDMPVWK